MLNDFYQFQAQTSKSPLALEVDKAKGTYIYDKKGKSYLDFVAGVSACSLGHCHPKIVQAIQTQLDNYLHVMVYGEYAQEPAVNYCKTLVKHLPSPLDNVYLTNSGTEATEGALKLARKYTSRNQLISCYHAYHGNTMGSMSVMGESYPKKGYGKLLEDVDHIQFNSIEDLEKITSNTAAVIIETIQGGAGFITPKDNYLQKVKLRCEQTGALLILDEIQPGFGRTGKLFGFEHYCVTPDILIIGKGMGGGMPAGAFISSKKIMEVLSDNPKLGHITTFGGHPVIAAASKATLDVLTTTNLLESIEIKEQLFRKLLKHPLIKEVRGIGLMLAIITNSPEIANDLIFNSREKGLSLFWLLFENKAVRVTPPLTISTDEIKKGCAIIINVLDELLAKQVANYVN